MLIKTYNGTAPFLAYSSLECGEQAHPEAVQLIWKEDICLQKLDLLRDKSPV